MTRPRPPKRPQRWRKGTRTLRWRTVIRAGNVPGQPEIPPTVDGRPGRPKTHVCGWCGGPRSHTNATTRPFRVLCHRCMRDEFGSAEAYDHFIRGQRVRTRYRERKWPR